MELNRREFLQRTGLASSAFIFGFQVPLKAKAEQLSQNKFSTHYIMVDANKVVFTMDKAEMGQGVITGQLTLFCDEAGLNPKNVEVVTAPVADVYNSDVGMQITGGSTSTKERWTVLRQAGANFRQVFLKAGAQHLKEDISQLKVEDGFVLSSTSGKKVSYNKLISLASQIEVSEAPLKDPSEFKYIGKPQPKADSLDKSTGQANYGVDFKKEGLLTAVILRSPTFDGKIKSFDASKALEMNGIKKVVKLSMGLAIVGEKYWQVSKARQLVDIQWEAGENGSLSSISIQESYKKALETDDGSEVHSSGDLEAIAQAHSDEIMEADFELPYLAHATMEPMNAAAEVTSDRVDIWSPNQAPTLIRNAAADVAGVSRDKVFVHTTKYLGGGFGRRSTLDYSLEAVELAKELKAPVKVMWSREDDMQHSPMRPITRHKLRGIVKDGELLGWEHRIAGESIMQQTLPRWLPQMIPGWVPNFLRSGLGDVAGGAMEMMNKHMTTAEGAKFDYEIPHMKVSLREGGVNLPIHFWRSVGHSFNGFVTETFMDEMAVKAHKDPIEFRKNLLKKNKRAVAVLDEVKKISQWGKTLPKGRALGVAYHFSFASHVAEVAEVELIDNQIKVHKVYCVVDCGIAVNPDIIKDQIKSGVIYGMSAALNSEVTIEGGAIQQSNFHDYPVVRMNEAPKIEVSIINSEKSPTGVGEPGLPPIAPAIGNALYSLTGKRLRSLPLRV